MKKKLNIAVIGGGLTGLTAAYRLSQKGHRVSILEKGENLGGLMGGFEINGTSLEKAYHHIFKTDKYIINLIRELGLEEKLTWNDSSIGLYYQGRVYPFVTPIDLLRFGPLNFIDKLRLGLVGLYLQFDKNWEKYVPVKAYEWMEKWAGKNAYRVVWEPLLKGKFHDHYKEVSMAWLWARIHTRGNSKEKGETKEKLGYLWGGFDQITKELASRIVAGGGKIFCGVSVEKIEAGKNNKVVIVIDGKKQTFDKVLASIPTEAMQKLTGIKYGRIDYLGAVIAVFTSSQSLSSYYWHNINDPNSPFLAMLQHTNLVDKKNYGDQEVYYLGTYLPHEHRYFSIPEKDVMGEFFKYLKKIFPDFDKNRVDKKYLFRLKNAQHVVDIDYQNRIPAYKTPINNLYLANFSQIFPEDRGTNFAVREGEKAAGLMIDHQQK